MLQVSHRGVDRLLGRAPHFRGASAAFPLSAADIFKARVLAVESDARARYAALREAGASGTENPDASSGTCSPRPALIRPQAPSSTRSASRSRLYSVRSGGFIISRS